MHTNALTYWILQNIHSMSDCQIFLLKGILSDSDKFFLVGLVFGLNEMQVKYKQLERSNQLIKDVYHLSKKKIGLKNQ